MSPKTPLLDRITTLADLRNFDDDQLPQLARELRDEMIDIVSLTGGHLGAGLGVVELTIALHKIFNTPDDRLIWDVGHQTYPHKILTGRRDKMRTQRQGGGLSGFTKRKESEYDPFGAGHSSTSISAGLGMAVARDQLGGSNKIISVIGDGAMSAGMAYEAMNNAGAMDSRMIVILNDNDMSIAPPVGAMSAYFARLSSGGTYLYFRDIAKQLAKILPKKWEERARRAEEHTRTFWAGGTFFEELGFYYVGPIDGHNFEHLLPVLRNIKDVQQGPILLHVRTQKGKGYAHAEKSADKFHGVSRFNVVTGQQEKSTARSYTSVFADQLIKEAEKDHRVTAITAAMPDGTGLKSFAKKFPDRCFDVGIAEQHAITFAAGQAAEGLKPFAAIYSTFLQRAYDQVVHDVAIQNLPVRFAIDRAGLVGADGPTHAGSFDLAFLSNLPNMVVMAASDEVELARMVVTSARHDEGPIAFRYPRGSGDGLTIPDQPEPLVIGKGRILKEGTKVALLSLGGRLEVALGAASKLDGFGLSTTVVDARFAKPLDTELIAQLAKNHEVLLTLEEGAVGGFGSQVLNFLAHEGLLDNAKGSGGLKVRPLALPDHFIDHNNPELMYKEAGLDVDAVIRTVFSALGREMKKNSGHLDLA